MAANSKPSVTGGSHTLPFEKLAPLDFERLCLWLVTREGYERAEHLGEAGSEGGRDVLAWRDGRRVVFQCKRVKAFTAAHARAEIEKLRGLPAEEQPQDLVFVVSQAVSAKTRRAAVAAWGDEETCQFWAGSELDERVKQHAELLGEFFQLPAEGRRSPFARGSAWSWGVGISILGVVLTVAAWLWPFPPDAGPPTSLPALYAIRVQVLDPQGIPASASKVRASVGNEPQRLPAGWWEVEIPAAKLPLDGKVSLWAESATGQVGRVELHLDADPNPRAEIQVAEPEAPLRGRVVDGTGRAVAGALVSTYDGAGGTVLTGKDGRFEMKLSVPRETRVRLRAEHGGARPGESFCYAGRESCTIELEER